MLFLVVILRSLYNDIVFLIGCLVCVERVVNLISLTRVLEQIKLFPASTIDIDVISIGFGDSISISFFPLFPHRWNFLMDIVRYF